VVGQRVSVGFLGGSCGCCEFCRNGDLVHCRNPEYTGIHHDGGYAEVMIAKASGLVSIPDDLSSVDAAPLLCAGLTTFSALRNAPTKAGDLVAVLGIGGLGHLGVQNARHMGSEIAAMARGADKAELAKKLGAHHYIDNAATDPAEALQALGGAKVVLITASGGETVAETFNGLRPGGVSIVLGVGLEPIVVSSIDLIFGSRKLEGALTGDPATSEETLRFSALSGVSAMIETLRLGEAPDAYAKMMAGKERFRMVLTKNGTKEFATAFVAQPMLYASVLNAPCIGVESLAAFFAATSAMYDSIAFTHETKNGSKTCLEWEGKVFGKDVAGTTILTHDEAGLIASVQLYHRPLQIVVRFSDELRRRLQGKLVSALFDIPR
jgi:alcohol dehydrogenase, propanol-preferring